MGRGADILVLFAGEDVDADHVHLGVTVLARLGGAHLDDLAGARLKEHVAVLSQGRALHRVGQGGSGPALLEFLIFRHVLSCK